MLLLTCISSRNEFLLGKSYKYSFLQTAKILSLPEAELGKEDLEKMTNERIIKGYLPLGEVAAEVVLSLWKLYLLKLVITIKY
jgi:hypothetical protein